MRTLTAAAFFAGVTDAALAHTPDGDTMAAIGHQLLSAHHLPVLVLAAAAVAAGLLVLRGRAR